MARLSSLKADSRKEVEGVWMSWEHGVSLLIARLNNPGFQAHVRKATRSKTKAIRQGSISDEEMERVSLEAIAHHVLLGWKNIEDDDGNPLEYSPETALELLSDPGLRDLYQFVLTQSNERELYRQEVEDDSKGN